MTLAARRRVASFVPWLALTAVTVFAIVQMRARHEAESRSPAVPVEDETTAAPVAASPAPPAAELVQASEAAETALDAALRDLQVARAEVARLRREGAEASARAEAAEARLTVAAARLEALEAARIAEEAVPVEAPVEPAAAPEAADAIDDWIRDAGADDPERRQRAIEWARDASPEDAAALEALLPGGADSVAVARLAAALPAGDATDALVIRLLSRDDGPPWTVVDVLGSDALLRPRVLTALLGRVPPPVLRAALPLLAGREAELGAAAERGGLTDTLATRLERSDLGERHVVARAAAILRLPGLAGRLLELTTSDEEEVRASAAHALSRIPDLDTVRSEAVAAVPRLLLDGSFLVRSAGVLLAEALLGGPVEYDPAGGEGARREALDRILDRLQG